MSKPAKEGTAAVPAPSLSCREQKERKERKRSRAASLSNLEGRRSRKELEEGDEREPRARGRKRRRASRRHRHSCYVAALHATACGRRFQPSPFKPNRRYLALLSPKEREPRGALLSWTSRTRIVRMETRRCTAAPSCQRTVLWSPGSTSEVLLSLSFLPSGLVSLFCLENLSLSLFCYKLLSFAQRFYVRVELPLLVGALVVIAAEHSCS